MRLKKGMKEFKEYYPNWRGNICYKCKHFEKNIKLIEYRASWIYDYVTVECEKCKTKWEFSV